MENVEIPLGHLTLKGWQRNPQGKKKLIALHGWLDNANSFLPLSYALPDDIHFLSIDLPGHGSSDWRPKGCAYHFIDYVSDVEKLLEATAFEKPILMGHSLGAGIASIAASCFPEKISKTILIEGIGPLSNTAEETPGFFSRFLKQQRKLSTQAPHFYESFDEVLKRRMRASPMQEQNAKLILERSLEQCDKGWSWKSDPRHMGRNPIRLTEEQTLAFLKEVTPPTTFVEATKGEYFHFERLVLPKRLKAVSHIKHLKIEGEHHVHMDKAKELAAMLLPYI